MSTYRYITATSLSNLLKASPSLPRSDLAVVDVRDDDFVGGNIKGCIHLPSQDFYGSAVNTLVKQLKDVPTVVFHCSLSQQRGPKAARIYAEARHDALTYREVAPLALQPDTNANDAGVQGGQQIYVLQDGFANFAKYYKNDATLVENYSEEAWRWR